MIRVSFLDYRLPFLARCTILWKNGRASERSVTGVPSNTRTFCMSHTTLSLRGFFEICYIIPNSTAPVFPRSPFRRISSGGLLVTFSLNALCQVAAFSIKRPATSALNESVDSSPFKRLAHHELNSSVKHENTFSRGASSLSSCSI